MYMFKVRILVSQFYWFLSLKVAFPPSNWKGVCCFSSFPWIWFHRLLWRFTPARCTGYVKWRAIPSVWFLNTATASFTFMLRNWSIIRNVTCFILFGMYFDWTRWGPHLGKACIIVIVCRTINCVLCCLVLRIYLANCSCFLLLMNSFLFCLSICLPIWTYEGCVGQSKI